jgi:hypothetical protein
MHQKIRVMVSASADLFTWRHVSQEMLLSAVTLRLSDSRAPRIASV